MRKEWAKEKSPLSVKKPMYRSGKIFII